MNFIEKTDFGAFKGAILFLSLFTYGVFLT